jgi:hypothetical protein
MVDGVSRTQALRFFELGQMNTLVNSESALLRLDDQCSVGSSMSDGCLSKTRGVEIAVGVLGFEKHQEERT